MDEEPQATADTDRFQVQFGPDGAARLVLFREDGDAMTPFASLTLIAEDADLLARLLTTRRATYDEQRRAHQAGTKQ